MSPRRMESVLTEPRIFHLERGTTMKQCAVGSKWTPGTAAQVIPGHLRYVVQEVRFSKCMQACLLYCRLHRCFDLRCFGKDVDGWEEQVEVGRGREEERGRTIGAARKLELNIQETVYKHLVVIIN